MKARVISNSFIKGTYYKLSLKPSFRVDFFPGQFVMINVNNTTHDPLLPRAFSIYRSDKDENIEILYNVIGKGTTLLTRYRQGDMLEITGPLGKAFPVEPAEKKEEIFVVAGGIGVAPMVSLTISLKKCYSGKRIIFFLGGRRETDLLCVEELEKVSSELILATNDGSRGVKGYVTDALEGYLQKRCGDLDRECKVDAILYACGPIPMLNRIIDITAPMNIESYFSLEAPMACGIGICMGCAVESIGGGYYLTCKDGPVFRADEIRLVDTEK